VTAVLLAAGHGKRPDGGWDPGTTFLRKTDGKLLEEHALNERAMWACYDELRWRNFTDVKLERGATRNTEDRLDGNWARLRADLATTASVRVAVEFHHDWHKAARGGFGIYPKAIGYRNDREAALCHAIEDAYLRAGLPVKPSYADARGLGLIRKPKFPTIIWECDRLGDAMTSPEAAGKAVAAGLLAWLGAS
jgi:hypothetical protein